MPCGAPPMAPGLGGVERGWVGSVAREQDCGDEGRGSAERMGQPGRGAAAGRAAAGAARREGPSAWVGGPQRFERSGRPAENGWAPPRSRSGAGVRPAAAPGSSSDTPSPSSLTPSGVKGSAAGWSGVSRSSLRRV